MYSIQNASFSKNRRKQLFKQPIKKSLKYDEDEDDENDEDDYFIELKCVQ